MLLSYFADDPAVVDVLNSLRDIPAEFVCVSRRALQQTFAACVTRDLSRQALLGLALMGLLVLVLIRKVRAIALVFIPPVTGIAGMLVGLRIAGQPLTPVSMLSALLLVGICIDYGVFMLEAWQRGTREAIGRGLTLAWLTTAGGAALLLVAEHPVLYATGLTLSVGVTCGYASARWVVWSAAEVMRVPVRKEGST